MVKEAMYTLGDDRSPLTAASISHTMPWSQTFPE